MKKEQFCEHLSGKFCSVVGEKCFRLQVGKHCEYMGYLSLLTQIDKTSPPIARKTIVNLLEPFKENLKDYARKGAPPGMKRVIATPLEKGIGTILKSELNPLGVSMSETAKRYYVWKNCRIIADGLAEKEGYPTCIFSVKTWVGAEQVRETFAYGYLAKTWLGQRNIRVYEIGLQKYTKKAETKELNTLIEVCKPYLDGVFYLTTPPYIDDLIEELREVYSDGAKVQGIK